MGAPGAEDVTGVGQDSLEGQARGLDHKVRQWGASRGGWAVGEIGLQLEP